MDCGWRHLASNKVIALRWSTPKRESQQQCVCTINTAKPFHATSHHDMQCYAIQPVHCNLVPYHATSCPPCRATTSTPYRAILCNAIPHHAIHCYARPWKAIPHLATPWCHVMSSNGISWHSTPCLAMQHHAMPCHTMQRYDMPSHIM